MELCQAWSIFEENLKSTDLSIQPKVMCEVINILSNGDMLDTVEDYVLTMVENSIEKELIPLLNSHEKNWCLPNLVELTFNHASQVMGRLGIIDQAIEHCNGQSNIMESCQRMYKTCLELPHHVVISKSAEEFYSVAYNIYQASQDPDNTDEDDENDGTCLGCSNESCICDEVQQQLVTIKQRILEMGLFNRTVEEMLYKLTQTKIKDHVNKICGDSFDQHYLENLEMWLNTQLLSWLQAATDSDKNCRLLNASRLKYLLYESFVNLRLSEILPMVIEYPESKPAFEDLHKCLPHTHFRKELIQTIKNVFENRILHPGVTTTDILTAYIQSIQALRVLDPSCVILEIVTDPVKQYLRSREDTVRCIVSNLIDDSCDVLSEELSRGITDHDILDDDNIGDDWESWQPDPVDANPAVSSKTRRSTDIINMLVNIYGTKELFIKEYWNLLADRLLSNLSYSTLWEIKYFELLKIRFGEADLHKCEVMLKDVTDSKRLNSWINDELKKDEADQIPFEMNAMILSAQYWPSFRDEKVELPADMKSALEKYTKAYEIIKVNRTLKWEPHLGQVDIDIDMDSGKTLTFKTSPVNVAVIMTFQDQDVYTVEELSEKLQMSSSVVRRCVSYWQARGLLREEKTDRYRLNKDQAGVSTSEHVEEEETESALASAEQQKEEELQVLWTYINGMLTNMDAQPLTRIHSLLKMFANTDCSLHDLEKFLGHKVREGKLIHTSGVYKLATS